jgi:hypothetical protein
MAGHFGGFFPHSFAKMALIIFPKRSLCTFSSLFQLETLSKVLNKIYEHQIGLKMKSGRTNSSASISQLFTTALPYLELMIAKISYLSYIEKKILKAKNNDFYDIKVINGVLCRSE